MKVRKPVPNSIGSSGRFIAAVLYAAWLSTTGSAQPIVVFPDPNLEAAARAALLNPPNPLRSSDIEGLTCLSASDRQITNLSGLEWATNLTALCLNRNSIYDLAPLQGLAKLNVLELEQNPFTDLSPLGGLTNLRCLVLGENPITDYSPLGNLTNLVRLSVHGSALRDMSVLQSLGRLRSLTLWSSAISDLSPLVGMTGLDTLDLRWNSVVDGSVLATGPTNLTSLYLGGNALSGVPPVRGLSRLTLLNLADNGIQDLSPLAGMTNLNYLVLSGNPITNYSIVAGLTGLVNLELRGNSLSNLTFLSGLSKLAYADLSSNAISDLSALAKLSNLSSLVLGGNPLTDYSALSGMTALTNLWLYSNRISDAGVVSGLTWLQYLDLESNSVADLSPLLALTNLAGLALSRNPIADPAILAEFTNLTTIRLEGNWISNLTFLAGMPRTRFLSLAHNQITDLSPVAGLANLQDLYLRRNRIRELQPVLELPRLANVDLSLNLLDLSPGSSASSAIRTLQTQRVTTSECACGWGTNAGESALCAGVNAVALPTNQPPALVTPARWFIASDTLSSLRVSVLEDPAPEEPLVVTASSSNPELVSVVGSPLPGTNQDRTLSVNAASGSGARTTQLIMTVTDEIGLSNNTTIEVIAVTNLSLSSICPNLDSNIVAAIGAASGTPADQLGTVDLLRMTNLYAFEGSLTDSCLWQWMTNLTTLYIGGPSVHELSFVTNLSQLTLFSLYRSGVQDVSPLAGMTNLNSLSLRWNSITNCATVVPKLINLTSLDLGGNSISNLSFLQGLTSLNVLGLEANRITDLGPLTNLPNLKALHVAQNLLTDITPLAEMAKISYVDCTLSLLDLSEGSSARAVIDSLLNREVSIDYWPQRNRPFIQCRAQWFVPANATSSLSFYLTDNAIYGAAFSVNAVSSNTNLVPNPGVSVAPGTNGDWLLTVAPSAHQTGTTTITLTVTNDAGLSAALPVTISVLVPEVISIPDPALVNILLSASGKPSGDVTSVDLLDLTDLDASGENIFNLSGLEWATNLTTLSLDNNLLTDLTVLAKLSQLTSLSLSNNLFFDISPLSALSNLSYLDLGGNPITNYNRALASLANLVTLRLDGSLISDLAFLQSLTGLCSLSLEDNRISDLSPLMVLTNLAELYLRQNLLAEIAPLQQLPVLSTLDVRLNLLNLKSGAPAARVITDLMDSGVCTEFLPQRELVGEQLFGTTNVAWKSGGDAAWFGQSDVLLPDAPAAQSGPIAPGQESWLEAAVDGPGVLTFSWQVSSETNVDFLEFNSPRQTIRISGEVAWQTQSVLMPEGPQMVRWRYLRQSPGLGNGLDAGWVTQVGFTPGAWLECSASRTRPPLLTLHGLLGEYYLLQTSTNLVDWSPWGSVAVTNGIFPVTETAPPGAVRFFRAQTTGIISLSPRLDVSERTAAGFSISWVGPGMLQSAPTPLGPWTEIASASPYSVCSTAAKAMFYRVRVIQ